MHEIVTSLKETAGSYSIPELIGMMTVGWFAAILLVVVGYRVWHAFWALKAFEAADVKAVAIEQQLEQLQKDMEALQEEYTLSLAQAKQEYAEEMFELQQIIFERNSEILDLKSKLLISRS